MLAPLASWCEVGLDACLLLLPLLLALVPRGAAPLVAVAGLCAVGLVLATPQRDIGRLRVPALVLGLLVLWGGLSIVWAIVPWRGAMLAVKLTGLFAAALALAAAAARLSAPRRLALCMLAGSGFAIVIAGFDLASGGGLSQFVTVRAFAGPRLNQIAVWLTILVLPSAALLVCRGRRLFGVVAAGVMAGTILLLDGAAAKIALLLSIPFAALFYLNPRLVGRLAAALSVVAILVAPLTLPRLAGNPELMTAADALKNSGGHRLLIWSFAGKRIAEKPLHGWGLDSSRSIPGGNVEVRPQQQWLPLHPHNAALQVWLELGAPGALLFAAFVAWLWLRLGAAPWPLLYTAGASGSLAATLVVAFAGWGIWQEWWLSMLGMAAFAILAMARAAARE